MYGGIYMLDLQEIAITLNDNEEKNVAEEAEERKETGNVAPPSQHQPLKPYPEQPQPQPKPPTSPPPLELTVQLRMRSSQKERLLFRTSFVVGSFDEWDQIVGGNDSGGDGSGSGNGGSGSDGIPNAKWQSVRSQFQ